MSVEGLYDSALLILEAAASGLGQDRTGHPAPDRCYISHGPPAVDPCESGNGQLTVTITGLDSRPLGTRARVAPDPAQACALLPVARLAIELWRCVPNSDEGGLIPTAAALTDSAHGLAQDAYAMMTWLYAERAAGNLAADGCDAIGFGGLDMLGPEGGAAGWRVDVDVVLDGIGP